MSEIRSVICGATSRSLVLVDEICRGTETAKGTCIAGGIVETLDQIGCLGIISTHLHGIFDLPLATKNILHKAMGIEVIDGHIRPTWKLIDGVCRESLAFETALREGVPVTIIRRAEELYNSINTSPISTERTDHKSHMKWIAEDSDSFGTSEDQIFQKEVENAVTTICQQKLIELYKKKCISEIVKAKCVAVGVREKPPPSTVGTSSIYVLLRPDKKLYVGQVTYFRRRSTYLVFSISIERKLLIQTDDLEGRIRTHRSKAGMKNALFMYVIVPGKSIASQLETLLINQLPIQGFGLANNADGKHRNFGTASNLSSETLVPCTNELR